MLIFSHRDLFFLRMPVFAWENIVFLFSSAKNMIPDKTLAAEISFLISYILLERNNKWGFKWSEYVLEFLSAIS